MPHVSFATPLGDLTLIEEDGALVAAHWGRRSGRPRPATALLAEARRQVEEYLAGRRRRFDLPVRFQGTPFQAEAWEAIRRIPFGATRSYGDIAHDIGSGPRAVAGACARNPLCIIVPCHRVIGSGGRLGGYSGYGGLETKKRLLALEGVPPLP